MTGCKAPAAGNQAHKPASNTLRSRRSEPGKARSPRRLNLPNGVVEFRVRTPLEKAFLIDVSAVFDMIDAGHNDLLHPLMQTFTREALLPALNKKTRVRQTFLSGKPSRKW